ncbi:hypothetical protein QOZ80_7AG0576010 [Eleusine coracana subsp. coracana]|nr:hypothetical protein QOZ80_7AG0576010 [Eleusine coracana subsp. coracana]
MHAGGFSATSAGPIYDVSMEIWQGLIIEPFILLEGMLLIVSLGKKLVKGITLMYPGSMGSVAMQITFLLGTVYCFRLLKLLILI